MKRRMITALFLAAALTISACGSSAADTASASASGSSQAAEAQAAEPAAEEPTAASVSAAEEEAPAEEAVSAASVQAESQTEGAVADQTNPWEEFDSYDAAAESAGMNLAVPVFGNGFELSVYRTVPGDVFELQYHDASGRTVIVRKGISSGNGEDLDSFAGDYNVYDEIEDKEYADIVVLVKENEAEDEDICFAGTWYIRRNAGPDNIYSVSCTEGIPEKEFERMILRVIAGELTAEDRDTAVTRLAQVYLDDLEDALEDCRGFRGAAGSSLKAAAAASDLLDFAVTYGLKAQEAPDVQEAAGMVIAMLSEAERTDLAETFKEMVAPAIDQAFVNYESIRPAFTDSGEDEDMLELLAAGGAEDSWKVLKEALTAVL